MKKILSVLALVALLCGCSQQDWGTLETVNYPIDGEWTALDISNAFNVTTSVTATEPVAVVTIGEKAHQYVQVEVKDGTLYIGIKKWNFVSNEKATVVLPANSELGKLRVSGASSYHGTLFGDDVSMKLSGASHFDGNMTVDNADVELSGASHATINGYCMEELDVRISGASQLDGVRFPCTKISGEISGASFADVTCCESLEVEVSGASRVTYGTPGEDCPLKVNCDCTGASTVEKR